MEGVAKEQTYTYQPPAASEGAKPFLILRNWHFRALSPAEQERRERRISGERNKEYGLRRFKRKKYTEGDETGRPQQCEQQ